MEEDDARPSRHTQWRLVDRDGGFFVLPESVTLLGREGCHIATSSRSVDLKHAIITFDYCTSCFKIKDLSSLNGTYVNDMRIPEQTYTILNHGDHLRLGYDATVYRVELMVYSPQGFVQCLASVGDALPAAEAAACSLSPTGAVDSRCLQAFARSEHGSSGGARPLPPSLPVAECQGCIKEQLLHHTCDDNAEDTRQAALAWDNGRKIRGGVSGSSETSSPSGERVANVHGSPMLPVATVVSRPSWDRNDGPDYAAASTSPWRTAVDFSSNVLTADRGSSLRKSYSMPEGAVMPSSPSAAAAAAGTQPGAARGTPLYGQPEWWGDRGVGEDSTAADASPPVSQRPTQWQHRAAEAFVDCVSRSERSLVAPKPSATRPASLQSELAVAHAAASGGPEMTSAISCQPKASPGKPVEPVMPSTAFTVNFDVSSDLSQGEDALSPKVGDSLSRFMPEQLRQSLRKRHKKTSKDSAAAEEPQLSSERDGPSVAVGSLTNSSAAKAKKDGGMQNATVSNADCADSAHSSEACALVHVEKNLKAGTVSSSVAFLMRRMYDNGSEDAAGRSDDDTIGDTSDITPRDQPAHDAAHGNATNDDAVSEAGTYTVDAGDASRGLAGTHYSDNDLSSLDSGSDAGASPQPRPPSPKLLDEDLTLGDRRQLSSSTEERLTSASPVMCMAVGQQSTFDTGLPIRDDLFHSSLDVEVGRWHADSGADSSIDVPRHQTVTLSKPGGKDSCSSPIAARGILGRGAAATNAAGSRRSPPRPENEISWPIAAGAAKPTDNCLSPNRGEGEPEQVAALPAAATDAMFAGDADARNSIISPVEHDAELLLSAAAAAAASRLDDSSAGAARRARREATSELSKARLLQELGIGDEPVQPVAERPKLVQELLSSRKHHREDDPVIVSSSKNFFEKIRPKSDAEPGSRAAAHAGKPPLHQQQHDDQATNKAEAETSGSSVLDGAGGDTAAALRMSLAGGSGGHWVANGHHGHHSLGAALSDLHERSGRVSPGGGSNGVRHAADPVQQLQIAASSRVAISRRRDSPPQAPDSPRDGDESGAVAMTSRTDASVRTELLLRPTEEFVRSMSAKHASSSNRHHRRSEPSGLDAAAAVFSATSTAANFEPVTAGAESGRGDGVDRDGAATWSDGRWAEPNRLDSRPPRQPTVPTAASSVTQSKRSGGESLAGTSASGSLRGMTGETVMMSLASRSGRSSADSLASRGSSDGSFLHGAVAAASAGSTGRAAKERAAAVAQPAEYVHARHSSDTSVLSSSIRSAQPAATGVSEPSATAAAAVSVANQQRVSSAARPNRTFELRRARTLAAPETPSERSSARSSTSDSSGVKPRSRSGSLERASEVSLGARIVQRSRQSAAAAGGTGSTAAAAAGFSAEIRGAKLPLAAKTAVQSSGSTFARSDGGRYSMRVNSSGGSGASAAAAAAGPGKADQRSRKQAGGSSNTNRRKSSGMDLGGNGGSSSSAKGRSAAASLLSSQAKAELEREKAAWERRRSYDPRRAAALASTSGASSVSSTPRQTTSSLGSRASSGTSSPVTPIALRQQQQQPSIAKQQPVLHYAPPPLLLDGGGGSVGASANASPLATASSSRRGSAGTAEDDADYFEAYDDDGSLFTTGHSTGSIAAEEDYKDDDATEQAAENVETELNSSGSSYWKRPSDPLEDPIGADRLHSHGTRSGAAVVATAAAVSAAKHELQIAKMSSELAKDLELLSRGAAAGEDEDLGNAASEDGGSVGPLASGRWLHRHGSGGGDGSSGDEMASSADGRSDAARALPLASRFVRGVSGFSAEDFAVPDSSRSHNTDATTSEATERADSCSGKSAFTSYSAFTEPGVTPPGKANSPALSPVKKKVVEAQSEENGGSPQIPDPNYDGVMVSSIKHISNRLSKSTSRILTRLREKLDLSSAHSSEEEAEAADRAAETLLGDHGVTELPGSQELASALRTLRRAERNVRAVERALFTNDSYPEITPTVTTHERDHYLAEIKRIRDEITGFKPITSAPTLSTEDAKKVTAVASMSASVTSAKVLATKPSGFTTVKSLTSLKKTYY